VLVVEESRHSCDCPGTVATAAWSRCNARTFPHQVFLVAAARVSQDLSARALTWDRFLATYSMLLTSAASGGLSGPPGVASCIHGCPSNRRAEARRALGPPCAPLGDPGRPPEARFRSEVLLSIIAYIASMLKNMPCGPASCA
jgi:hypothetical protein